MAEDERKTISPPSLAVYSAYNDHNEQSFPPCPPVPPFFKIFLFNEILLTTRLYSFQIWRTRRHI